MFWKSKYIVIDTSLNEYAIIFPETLNHSDVAFAMTYGDLTKVMSAGFVSIGVANNRPKCSVYGESISLNTKSRPEDYKIVNQALGINVDEDEYVPMA